MLHSVIVSSFASHGSAGTKVSRWQTLSGLRALVGLPVPAQLLGASPTPAIAQEGCQSLCWDTRHSPALLAHPRADIPACCCPQGGARCPALRLRWTLTAGPPASPRLLPMGSHRVSWQVPLHLPCVTAHHGLPQSLPTVQPPSGKENGAGHSRCSVTPQQHMINMETTETLSSTDFFLFSSLVLKILHRTPQREKQHYKHIETGCHCPKISFYELRKFHYSRMTTIALLRTPVNLDCAQAFCFSQVYYWEILGKMRWESPFSGNPNQ